LNDVTILSISPNTTLFTSSLVNALTTVSSEVIISFIIPSTVVVIPSKSAFVKLLKNEVIISARAVAALFKPPFLRNPSAN
jgi:hypothetical protein